MPQTEPWPITYISSLLIEDYLLKLEIFKCRANAVNVSFSKLSAAVRLSYPIQVYNQLRTLLV